ncbi:hypothetical protein B0H67DRAFT_487179 [Lasiosphaeris hirsuta]|uniref:Membrane anchor Opy2 N-terminal domain-containing protein n=1 Tax=Lasiosphaeris hirsuta TaxID=260670 RepID=A0AA40ARA0_9PEZI|nr:hypothetical protein B0H67DRAFT_487179 [Lasiosphaeris hirsuta]
MRSVSRTFDLTKRETCLVCDSSTKLVCPPCGAGTQCQFVYPPNCFDCPRATCLPSDEITPQSSGSKSGATTNVGAIAGGVVGGVFAIAAVTYLVWRYCIRTRRQPIVQETWDDGAESGDSVEKTFAERRDHRSSTHTVHSIASTVLTRASNIIQIAYIPGVTNRATASPTVLVPPVPPLPLTLSQANSPAPSDQHFFVPGDLRDSTYSALSGYSDRTSYARTSYAPRSSVASTIYGKNAVIVAPAQTGMRAKPAMVSVRTGLSNGSAGSATPPVPSIDYEKFTSLRPPSPANSTFSVGSTFLNNASAHTATPARAMVVRVGSVKKIGPLGKPKVPEEPIPSPSVTSSSSTVRDSNSATIIVDSPTPDQGPFSDPPKPTPAQSTTSLSAVIEEATRRASQRESRNSLKGRERSPFGDEHATQD